MRQYTERQHFGAIIKWIMVSIIIAVNLAIIVGFAIEKTPLFEEIMSWVITPTILLFVVFAIFYTKLDVTFTSESITYRLKPFEWKDKQILKSEIQSIRIKDYKWFQYGGFGKRRSIRKNTINYILHCGPVLEIVLKNGSIKRFSVKNKNQLNRFIKEHYGEVKASS